MTSTDSAPSIPLFWESEIKWGRILGKGNFCLVMVVQDIRLISDDDDNNKAPPPFPTSIDHHTLTTISSTRQRLADKYSISRHKKRDLKAAIYGKINQMDDPMAAPKLALKKVRSDTTDLSLAQADFQRAHDNRCIESHNVPRRRSAPSRKPV